MNDLDRVEVVVDDAQDDIGIDAAQWSRLAAATLAGENVVRGRLDLSFVDEASMAELNREHMGADGPTDVLAFPLDAPDEPVDETPLLLGDVVVCPTIARRQAARGIDDELALLVVHGVLHVLGHDHAAVDEARRMREREEAHLRSWREGAR